MSYDVEWSATADFTQVLKSLDNVEKSIGQMERAANRGFDKVADKAGFVGKQLDKMVSLKFFSQAMSGAQSYLVDSLEKAGERSVFVKSQLDKVHNSLENMRATIGIDLTVNGGASDFAGIVDWLEKIREKTVDVTADAFSGFGRFVTGRNPDSPDTDAAGVRRDINTTVAIEKRARALKAIADMQRQMELQALRLNDQDQYSADLAEAKFNYQQRVRQANEAAIAGGNPQDAAAAIALAQRLYELEVARAKAKKQEQELAIENAKIAADDAAVQAMILADRQRMVALEQLAGKNTNDRVGLLRDLGSDRDASRMMVRQQRLDELDALARRTDLTDTDKANQRNNIENTAQWRRDALELRFMAEDAQKNAFVTSRSIAGGLAGANKGVSQAALNGGETPEAKAAKQTAAQTKESARLLALIEASLREREQLSYR